MIKPLEIGKFQEVLLFNLTLSRKFMSCPRQIFTIILHINLCSCRLLRFLTYFLHLQNFCIYIGFFGRLCYNSFIKQRKKEILP